MSNAIPSKEEMLSLANKVMDDEQGFRQLLKELKLKSEKAERDLKIAESNLELAKARVLAMQTSKNHWESFLGMMEALADKWGVSELAVLTSKDRTQEDPSPEPVVQKMDPVTKKRLDEGKLCMFRDQKNKKWCPAKLSPKQKKQKSDYCAKHHSIVYDQDE